MDCAGTLAFFQLSRPRRVGRPAACSQSCCGHRCDRGSQPQTSPWASVAVATAFQRLTRGVFQVMGAEPSGFCAPHSRECAF
jgi:hypothetical protein